MAFSTARTLILIGGVILILGTGALIAIASDSFSISYGSNQNITAFSECQRVVNNSPTALSVYIPTVTSAEWASFKNNPPSGVSLSTCTGHWVETSYMCPGHSSLPGCTSTEAASAVAGGTCSSLGSTCYVNGTCGYFGTPAATEYACQ